MLTTPLGLNIDELRALVQEEDEPAYRGDQLAEWIYGHGARTTEIEKLIIASYLR